MKKALISWDIYEIHTDTTEIHGVMLRGRLRKLGLEESRNILCENATDIENCVRFAVPSGEDASMIEAYLHKVISDSNVTLVRKNVSNPVLSKLKVNQEERYSL